MAKQIMDKTDYVMRKAGHGVWSVLKAVLHILVLSLLFAILYYLVFASLVSTDEEKRLSKENALYSQYYPQMQERLEVLRRATECLEAKDQDVYSNIFGTSAPAIDPINTLDFLAQDDTIASRHIIDYTYKKSGALLSLAEKIEADMADLAELFSNSPESVPPLTMPLDSISYVQVGASVGDKLNPFLKVNSRHSGIDIIAPQGADVHAVLGGTVSYVSRSRKGQGNVVEITHTGGYVTRYAHLLEINVSQGQRVARGKVIGRVGISGKSFAPHLHYEILKDSLAVDPVNYFFASVGPDEYANMMFMSVHTGQSMD